MSRSIDARLKRSASGKRLLLSPSLGFFEPYPSEGLIVRGGEPIGSLDVMGTRYQMCAPAGVQGLLKSTLPKASSVAVAAGEVIAEIGELGGDITSASADQHSSSQPATNALVFVAPSSGRFYRRPSPDRANFVEEGQTVDQGQTVCLLEIMKTFNRIGFDGPGLPAKARITKILVEDGEDVSRGDALFEIENVLSA